MKKIFRNIIGFFLLGIGVLGGFIPVLQGWVFVLTGFIIIDIEKKAVIEKKIIHLMLKYRLTSKLAQLWLRVKKDNLDIIEHDKEAKIRAVYHDIHKEKSIDDGKEKK